MTIQNGGYHINVGFSSSETPYVTLHNKGILMSIRDMMYQDEPYMLGEKCDFLANDHNIEYPVKNGRI